MRSIDLSNQHATKLVASELIVAARTGNLTIWVGAGISCSPPASLPLASQMVRDSCQAIATELSIPLRVLLAHQGDVMRLEPFLRLVEVVSSFKDVENLLNILRYGKPNQNHLALARLLSAFPGTAVISLNFDYLIEEALRDLFDIQSKVVVPAGLQEGGVFPLPAAAGKNSAGSADLISRIVKPHGTLIMGNGTCGIVATVQELGSGPSRDLQERIMNLINGRTLLVCGYSDDDLDLFPLLQTTHPRTVYWNTLSSEIPPKVNGWLLQPNTNILTTHLMGRCEHLFGVFPRRSHIPLSSDPPLKFDKFSEQWVRDIDSVAKVATIAAWLAQDRHRLMYAKGLYMRALQQEECKRDISLGRFIRYRYAELLRHQVKKKKDAFIQYILVLGLAFRLPLDLPLIFVTIRSLAASLRSMAHRSRYGLALAYSTLAMILLVFAWILVRITPDNQWKASRFHRDKGGTWLPWEVGMVILGLTQKLWWPKSAKQLLLRKALRMFELSEGSNDLYERSASIFSKARTIGMVVNLEDDPTMMRQANALLSQAKDLFILLDDVTGLQNIERLQKALINNSPDPWLSSS